MSEATLLGRFANWLQQFGGDDEEVAKVDREYLRGKEYRWLETFVVKEYDEYIRCNLCGRLFPPEEITDAVDHAVDDLDKSGMSEEKDLEGRLTRSNQVFEKQDLLEHSTGDRSVLSRPPEELFNSEAEDD